MLETGDLTGGVREQAVREVARIFDRREAEGYAMTPELMERFQEERTEREDYGDWFRRSILIPNATSETFRVPVLEPRNNSFTVMRAYFGS